MATHLDKDRTVALLDQAFGALVSLCRELGPDQAATPTCLPGWSVHDAVAHVVGTESMLDGLPTPEVDVSHLTHLANPVAEANEAWVESFRPLPFAELTDRLAEVTGRRLAALGAMTQAEFDAPSWTPAGPDETYGRFMRIRHYDTFLHELDVRFALGLPAREAADELRSCLDEVATGLGYIVGRRARFPDGSSVRIEVEGAAAATYLIRVDGRAAVVDALDGPPDVVVVLPVVRYLRLTAGRADVVPDPDPSVRIEGDRALGERLVANLAFTI
jgi:uncharacterized protein (TIGR03083 family)